LETSAIVVSLALAIAVTAGACGSSTTSAPAGTAPATGAPGAGSQSAGAPSGPTYATVEDMASTLNAKGIPCTLQYAGLKDDVSGTVVSICTIGDEQAYLKVWNDPANVVAFLSSPDGRTGMVAVGPNWTVTMGTPGGAQKVATALGGTSPSAVATPGTVG
jgi:hypothetical protein